MRNFFIYTGIIMGVIFLVFGVLMFVMPSDMMKDWSPSTRYILGSGVFVYGIFRIYRSIKMLKNPGNNSTGV